MSETYFPPSTHSPTHSSRSGSKKSGLTVTCKQQTNAAAVVKERATNGSGKRRLLRIRREVNVGWLCW